MLRFEDWLIAQQDREDIIGELARVPSLQNIEQAASARKFDEHKNWVDIIVRMAEPGHIPGFNDAWQEFLLAKQAAQASSD